ncbi:hypothetical protein [Mucilaginibacter sp. L3T2-6]|uniref:hypothetical protein n=1 Tax=Mucilaginibacter sp. L3T2-6 TaxID=3062491 RepID=UPI0026763C0F|nr:hypothetical protein [Mucilaginibacter sp. L3T2-6]MDO3642904.1 hypothetical protein [Mucilaginibacter sp. L3T2-6]MDV6215229.1 hypothetical protein [Mucilaginibacter sp. L3T2-6]
MEEADIKQLWHAYDLKLEQSLQLNQKIICELQAQKAENNIGAFRRQQIAGLVLGILWITVLLFFAFYARANLYFAGSIGLIAVFNIFAVASYIRHLSLLNGVNITGNVTDAQQRLAAIQTSLSNTSRIMILQTPLWCIFWYNQDLVRHAGIQFWVINLSVVTVFVISSIYLYKKLSYKNIHIKWVKAFNENLGGKRLAKAMEFLKEIDEYKRES